MIKKLNQINSDLEQVGREIFYAMLEVGPQANLKSALELLGVYRPIDVGLSNSIIEKIKSRNNKKEEIND